MTHRLSRAAAAALALLACPALGLADTVPEAASAGAKKADAAPAGMPEMTPEEQAEMALYMKAATPGPQHAELAAMAGSYDLALKSWHEPDGEVMTSTGTAKRTLILEGRVLTEDTSSSIMGMPFTGYGTHGYDNVTGRWWSTWSDTMGTGLMVSDGTCDADRNCTFVGSWNDPVKKGPVKARMTTRWPSKNVQIFEMYGPAKDGKEFKMMEITYTRK